MPKEEMMATEFSEFQAKEGKSEYGRLMAELVAAVQNQYIEIEPRHGGLGYFERVYRPLLRYSQANPQKLLKDNFPDFDVLKEFLSIEGENIPSDLFLIYVCTALSVEALQAHNAKENLLSVELLLNSYYWCGFQNCIEKHDAITADTLIKENNSKQGLKKALIRHEPTMRLREEACNLARELKPWKNYREASKTIFKKLEHKLVKELRSDDFEDLLIGWFKQMPDRMDVFKMARTAPSPKKKK